MIPSCFVCMESFPLNANDKLDNSALPIPSFTPTVEYITPRTSLEKRLLKFGRRNWV